MTSQPACRGVDPELFFPLGHGSVFQRQIAEAKAVCRGCPVREACDAFVKAHPELTGHGIWAGTTEEERRQLRRGKRRDRPAPESTPGTDAACHECSRPVGLRADRTLAPHSVHPGQQSTVATCPGSRRRPRAVAA